MAISSKQLKNINRAFKNQNPELLKKLETPFNPKQTLNIPKPGPAVGDFRATSNSNTFMDNLVNEATSSRQSHYQRVASRSKKADRKEAIKREVERRNATGGPRVNTNPHRQANKPVSEMSSYERQARRASISRRKNFREGQRNVGSLKGVNTDRGLLSRVGATANTLYGSALQNLKTEGNLRRAGIGTLQSAAASAGVHGGLAFLQGEDPWEAAKTGAVRGAFAGAGYQGLKAATHAKTGSIKGNLKHIASTTKQTYKAHTVAGNAAMKQGGVSNQLARVLQANEMSRQTSGIFGFNK